MKEIRIQYPCLASELTMDATVIHGDFPSDRRSVVCKAIWDTGASNTTLNADIITRLGLKQADAPSHVTHTANGDIRSQAYEVCLVLSPDWPPIKFCVYEMPPCDVDMLIGMDIIGKGKFKVFPENGKTVLRFALPI